MKRCPKCGTDYGDQDINFCLNDGELLSRLTDDQRTPFDTSSSRSADDSPPTMILDQARVTNPIGWNNPPAALPVPWQQAQPAVYPFTGHVSPDQTLAIVSLATGVASLTLGWCCSLGLLLGPAAIIAGIIALVQNKNDPAKFGGRGFAIGGIVTGSLFIVLWLIYIILVVLLNVIPNLG